MSAIYGILGEADAAELRAMGARLAHRGPAAWEWSPGPRVHLGVRDSGHGGSGETGGSVAFDGVLYNVPEIGRLVGDPSLAQASGDEARAVQTLYRAYGIDGFRHLNGQFAFALWDAERETLFLVRDPLGIRPLYFTRDRPGRFFFASEVKALLAVESVPVRPDREALQHIVCTKGLPLGRTAFAGVCRPDAGAWVAVHDGKRVSGRYWEVDLAVQRRSVTEHARLLRDVVLGSTRRQVERYSRLGLALGGGLDASIILAAIRHVAPGREVHTFTAGFGPEDSEILGAAETVRHFGTTHHAVYMATDELPDLLPSVVWHMEAPLGREAYPFLYALLREVAGHVDVLFGGYKADVLFGGMPRHRLLHLASRAPLGKDLLLDFLAYTQTGVTPGTTLGRGLAAAYFRSGLHPAPVVAGTRGRPAWRRPDLGGPEPLNRELSRTLQEDNEMLTAFGKLHLAFGPVLTSPLMDPGVIACAFTIPDRLKIRGLRQKYILRRALGDLLPEAISRRPKSLQKLRHDTELSDVLDGLADELLAPAVIAERGFFDPEYVDRLRRRPRGRPYRAFRLYNLWSLIVTEMWSRLFLDQRAAMAPVPPAAAPRG